jgi:hypothetical protein
MSVKTTHVLDDHVSILGFCPKLDGLFLELHNILLYNLSLPLLVIIPLNIIILFICDIEKLVLEEVFEYLPLIIGGSLLKLRASI